MTNPLFLDDLQPPSAEVNEAVKQIADDLCNKLYQKLAAIDALVSDEEIHLFIQELNKVAEDNKDNIDFIHLLKD